jgi:hypothetical protein
MPESIAAEDIAPEYIVWGYPENRDNMLQTFQSVRSRQPVLFARMQRSIAPIRYQLLGLVYGVPYGVTRIYRRMDHRDAARRLLPVVAAYDAASGTWDQQLDAALDASFTATAPASFAIDYTVVEPVSADRSVAGELPPGRYLIEVAVAASTDSSRRLIAATTVAVTTERISELGPTIDPAPYGAGDSAVYLLHHHGGGRLIVSQFDDGSAAAITSVAAYPILPMGTAPELRAAYADVAPLADWVPLVSTGVKARLDDHGEVRVEGDASETGYQILSPPVSAAPGARVTVRTTSTIEQGSVCLGALNRTQQRWLASSVQFPQQLSFSVDSSGGFLVVFYNCQSGTAPPMPSRFRFSAVRYTVADDTRYVDQLTEPLKERRLR